MNCVNCDSTKTSSNGIRGNSKRFKCLSCLKSFSIQLDQMDIEESDEAPEVKSYIRDQDWLLENINPNHTFVITSAQSNVDIEPKFFNALNHYCSDRDAKLIVIPIKFKVSALPGEKQEYIFPSELDDILIENNFKIHRKLKVLGALKISASAENPLSGLNPISKGDSVIVGHNQLQMNTIPVQSSDLPVIMTSTGTISKKFYSETKQGYKGSFNHSNSAVVVELDRDLFHIRHLNFDGKGFYDIDTYYTDNSIKRGTTISGIVTGDEHAIFADPQVVAATYTSEDSIVKTLKPPLIVRHDVLDSYSISHHHKYNTFTQYAKYKSGFNNISDELDKTVKFIVDTTPKGATNLIIASNHNDHLTRWLNEVDPKVEPWNALLYHKLMYQMLEKTSMGVSGAEYPNPFKLHTDPIFKSMGTKVQFLGRNEEYKIGEIEISNHGDKGANGSRGSRLQFASLPSKSIIGHSHSPGITKFCYQVGTSSYLNLEYNSGPSSWLQTHCIIHNNSERQLINIINGKWRR